MSTVSEAAAAASCSSITPGILAALKNLIASSETTASGEPRLMFWDFTRQHAAKIQTGAHPAPLHAPFLPSDSVNKARSAAVLPADNILSLRLHPAAAPKESPDPHCRPRRFHPLRRDHRAHPTVFLQPVEAAIEVIDPAHQGFAFRTSPASTKLTGRQIGGHHRGAFSAWHAATVGRRHARDIGPTGPVGTCMKRIFENGFRITEGLPHLIRAMNWA